MTTKTVGHTPGPWRTRLNSISFADGVYANETWIADLDCAPTGNEREANARLIAAAPELLEQLEALCVQIRASGYLLVPPNVEAVICKARGE